MNAIFTNPVAWPYERDVLVALTRFLKGFGAPVLVLGGGPSEAAAGPHTSDDYRAFCRALEDIGKRTKDLGVETVYHPHLDTFVERRDQLDRVMDQLDTRLAGLLHRPGASRAHPFRPGRCAADLHLGRALYAFQGHQGRSGAQGL